MSLSRLDKWTVVPILTLIQATSVDYPLQTAGGTIAVTGYLASRGVYDARIIKEACRGNWRHAKVNGLECSFALAQTVAWHTFASTLGVAAGTAVENYFMDYREQNTFE